MSAIAVAANSSATNAVASLLTNAASSATADAGSAVNKSASSDATPPSRDPVDTVDLSDRAKATLARAKTEQFAADKLAAQLQATRNPDGKPEAAPSKFSPDTSKLFDALNGSAAASETNWTVGSKWGDASISDAAFIDKYKDAFLGGLTGLPPEKREALQAAINTGALKFQQGSEVAGYNTRTVVTYNGGSGGGQGMSSSGYRAPTGAVKEAIEAGNAVALWTEDRGDVYVTW
jgi:hypothetical protein